MTSWRLEIIRLWRTKRALALAAVFVIIGLLGPVSAYYLPQIAERAGGGRIKIVIPPVQPADAIGAYARNALGIGVIALVGIAAAALAIDGRPALATFYRTRVRRVATIVIPRVVTTAAAGLSAFMLGTAAAWYETTMLIARPPTAQMLQGTALTCLYLVLVVALCSAAAVICRSAIAAAGLTLSALLGLPLLAIFPKVEPWLPSRLAGSLTGLLQGQTASSYLRAAATALTTIIIAIAIAVTRAGRRDL